MFLKFPKDNERFSWTDHIKRKMVQYQLSEARIKRVLSSPNRKEKGIAPETLAAMKRNDRGNKKEEIWIMYAPTKKRGNSKSEILNSKLSRITMISVWRYPGVSRPGKEIPIPEEILEELKLKKET
jgi:hypothetical protein